MPQPAPRTVGAFLAAAALLTGVACGGDSKGDGGGGAGSTTFVGVVSLDDGSASGSIQIVLQTSAPAPPTGTGPSLADPVNATGTLTLGGDVALTGTYDPDNDILALTGGGYTFGGGFDGVDRLEGLFTGPGNVTGTFVAAQGASGTAFCGTYAADDQSDSGTFSFVIAGSTVRGEAYSSIDQVPFPLDGVVSGNTITIYAPGTTTTLATGTRNGNNVSGTYDDGNGGTGTWTGSTCQ